MSAFDISEVIKVDVQIAELKPV